jgi:hypothetical protein
MSFGSKNVSVKAPITKYIRIKCFYFLKNHVFNYIQFVNYNRLTSL